MINDTTQNNLTEMPMINQTTKTPILTKYSTFPENSSSQCSSSLKEFCTSQDKDLEVKNVHPGVNDIES